MALPPPPDPRGRCSVCSGLFDRPLLGGTPEAPVCPACASLFKGPAPRRLPLFQSTPAVPGPLPAASGPRGRAARAELASRELARRSLLAFTKRFVPGYMAGWFHEELCSELERFVEDVEQRRSPRLMVNCPPRHGKSQIASVTFPAWLLGRHPEWSVIACSYGFDLAKDFSREAQGLVENREYARIFPDTKPNKKAWAADEWRLRTRGGYTAAGVTGAINGKGAHVLLIDDPHKNREEAESRIQQEAIWSWYTSTARTRLAPGGGIVVIQTRWNDEDLSGRILTREQDASQSGGRLVGGGWRRRVYPAIAKRDEHRRKQGEALHPERWPLDALLDFQAESTPREWNSLYQQDPVGDEGDYFRREWFQYYDRQNLKPSELVVYAAWDLAVSQHEDGDWTVGIAAGIDADENMYLLDLYRGRWTSHQIVERMIRLQRAWRPEVTGVENGQISLALGPFLDKRRREEGLYSMRVEPLKPGRRDKRARCRSIQGRMEQRKVLFPERASWLEAFEAELLRFDAGQFDDQVDALGWLGIMMDMQRGYYTRRFRARKSRVQQELDRILAESRAGTRSAMAS